ncbi:tetratricopeptide repeat protein [Sphingomonas sp. TF3]|uniref:tetratricopeptide repeat protein n=1 Tax=Sphingomonas sp. TF3 TaxID=2495580 RepID=UPI00163CBCE2|nr:tetratricopeptide repeat protein [Sphingomonas sp. TF3]
MFYLLTIAIQVLCVIDVIRNGRNQLWIMALVFLPLASTIAYVVLEVYPRFQGNRHVRTARATVAAKLDPDKDVRAARGALAMADTVANRMRLADALAAQGNYAEALPLYREAAERGPVDTRSAEKRARAEFETHDPAAALATLDAAPPASAQSDRDRIGLLRARILDALGRKDEALALYADLVTRLPGEEGRCRYAALLLDQGWDKKARDVLEEVEARMKLLDRQQRAAEAEMYRWAMARLGELRAVKA